MVSPCSVEVLPAGRLTNLARGYDGDPCLWLADRNSLNVALADDGFQQLDRARLRINLTPTPSGIVNCESIGLVSVLPVPGRDRFDSRTYGEGMEILNAP